MASHRNFSKKSRKVKEGYNEDFDKAGSYDCKNEESFNLEAWTAFLSYYRYYIDKFANDILGLGLYPFQKFMMRCMVRYQHSMIICCRGLGKSYLSAVFMVCMAILYPGIRIGIASGKGGQARGVIIQKIQGEISKNQNVAREIQFPIKTQADNCVVDFKNGSSIRAITLGLNQQGDNARGWRFDIIFIDEARLVPDSTIETVLVPMTKTKRPAVLEILKRHPDWKIKEKGKMIYSSSAYLKSCDLYNRFLNHYESMMNGDRNYFVCSLDYKVGVQAGLFDEEEIDLEYNKPSMTPQVFDFEYNGIFVGSSNESYYPYEITETCRTLEVGELSQPKQSKSIYVISHDVATSTQKYSDNAATHVIKLKARKNGTFIKEVVYTRTVNGMSLQDQRDMLRELVHIKFPNTVKLIIDGQSAGQGLLSMFYEPWEYQNEKGNIVEYPPLIVDDDEDGYRLQDAIPMIRSIMATNNFNAKFYPYMKGCFDDKSLRLITSSNNVDERYKLGEISEELFAINIEHDVLVHELSNIKQDHTATGAVTYSRITKTKKRDRATSLMYLLSYVFEMEQEGRANLYVDDSSDLDIFKEFTCL
jgi:hypothetical protein